VVAAGGISSETQIDRLTAAGVWGFTMGTAIFEGSYRPEAASLRDRVTSVLKAARRAEGALRA
jgi:phosphoribosylformimino-5-aminoimidazole carboxamide ribonucleotide (ProFAR) isomerase